MGLPDGQKVVATKMGTTTLEGGMKISNVLYVPKLNCSLISVSQLIDEAYCVMQFAKSLCVIQNHTSRMFIGLGEQIDRLYYFRGIRHEKAFKVDNGLSLGLWHRRMGHPSLKITELVSKVSSKNNDYGNKACDICQRAKQTRDSFPLSNHRASCAFEPVHCDLWGPYKTSSSCGADYFLTIVDDYSRAVGFSCC